MLFKATYDGDKMNVEIDKLSVGQTVRVLQAIVNQVLDDMTKRFESSEITGRSSSQILTDVWNENDCKYKIVLNEKDES